MKNVSILFKHICNQEWIFLCIAFLEKECDFCYMPGVGNLFRGLGMLIQAELAFVQNLINLNYPTLQRNKEQGYIPKGYNNSL